MSTESGSRGTKATLPREVQELLISLARVHAPRECCGFILDDFTVYPIRNIAQAYSEFEMHHGETKTAYMNLHGRLLGVYHSHPGGKIEPSTRDILSRPDGLRYWIVTKFEVAEWRFDGDQAVRVT